jgi:hypothetical protein
MLKSVIDSLDAVDEGFRSHYKAGTAEQGLDGKFILDVEAFNGFGLENVDGLKNALSSERTALAAEKARTKAFEGLDPVAAKDAVAKIKELGTLDPKKDVDRLVEEKLNAQLTQLNDRHTSEKTQLEKKIEARDGLLKSTFQREAAVKEIAAAKGDVDLLLPHVLPSVAFELEEGEDGSLTPKTKVIDEKGNTRIGDSQGGSMTIAQRVAEMKNSEKFARLFDGSGHSGSGDRQTTTPSGGGKKIATMSRKEKAALIGELGQAKYNERVNAERSQEAPAS